ncbi:MAG: toxin-antitoxin system HicB family antitoxin [bacterium]|nr:toxin-antitoxin system HicB family antitoxin [bacterium]
MPALADSSINIGIIRSVSDRYTYRVTWSAEDEEHVGLCLEFPSLSWLAPVPEEAFAGIREVVREALVDMLANNETPPEPLADRPYSGKFVVRIPPETHRDLVIRAAENGVSLNRLVSSLLAD